MLRVTNLPTLIANKVLSQLLLKVLESNLLNKNAVIVWVNVLSKNDSVIF